MSEKASVGDAGARTSDRNLLVANWFTIARAVWNMHDALLAEQSRTNQLLETLVELQGGTVPAPKPQQRPGFDGLMFDDSGQVIGDP